MINKKATVDMSFGAIITAILALIILVTIVYFIINNILIDKQIQFAKQQTERATKDCDKDDAIGITDYCPCDFNIQKKEEGQNCGKPSSTAEENCPALCKK